MFDFLKKSTVFPVFLVVLGWSPVTTSAQQDLEYSGPYQVDGYHGEADFSYRLVDNDTVFDGPFRMRRSNLDALLEKEDESFSFSGAFEDGYADGDWEFRFGAFRTDSTTQVVGYQYQLNVSGTQQEASGRLVKGKPDGKWTFTYHRVEDSEVAETLFKSSIEFENGVPQKSFRIENADSTLVGRFLRDGLAHDEWTLYSDAEIGAIENWYFTNGRLAKIQTQRDGLNEVFDVYTRPFDNPKTINLDRRYIKVLQLNLPSADSSSALGRGMPRLLAENASYYKKIDTILSELGKSAFLPEFKVKVDQFPLDSVETVRLDSIEALYRTAEEISQSFLNDTQLNILKLSDQEAAYLYSAITALHEKYVRPLGKIVDYHEEDILTYVPRDLLMQRVWPDGFPSKEIPLEGEEAEKSGRNSFMGPKANTFNFSGNSMTTVLQVARYAARSLDSIHDVLNSRLASNKRQQEFVTLEEQMIRQTKDLDSLIDSIGGKIPAASKMALKNIRTVVEARLGEYSNRSETEGKMDFGRGLVVCFDNMQKLATAVAKLPAQKEEIGEKYLIEIWNPFMAVLMDEEVKKRITTAYEEVLLPYLLERTTDDLSCGNANQLANLFEGTYQSMLQLRDENTAKLERKLRRERDPETVLTLFNLQNLPQKTEE